MTLVSTPNGLLVASSLFALAGLAVLARALFEAHFGDAAASRSGQTRVAFMVGLPMLALGLFMNGAGQFVTGKMGPGLACALLALAFALLLYAMTDGMFDDDATASEARVAPEASPRLLPQPPKLIAVEARDEAEAASDTARQALPA